MRKRKLSLVLALVLTMMLVLGASINAGAVESFKVYINEKLTVSDVREINGEIYVPLKTISENLGVKVEQNKQNNIISITTPDGSVSSIIGKIGPSVVGVIGKLKPDIAAKSYYQKNDIFWGTGVIIEPNGYIITNAHVVKDLDSIFVILSNSKTYEAKLKAIDEKTDLAMIKVDKGGLTPVTFGDISDIQVGESVIAIGTPLSLSLRNSASKGIISGLNRSIESEYKFIQSDAAINGGNSGGPLVNMKGDVIGINSVKYTGFGVEGLSFSIPVDTVKYAIDHFKKYGKIRRPYMGLEFMEGIAAMYGLPSTEGLTVTKVDENSPAEKDGLKVDDIITAVNGTNLTAIVDYNEMMKKYLPGDSIEFTVKRNETSLKIKAVFGETPEEK